MMDNSAATIAHPKFTMSRRDHRLILLADFRSSSQYLSFCGRTMRDGRRTGLDESWMGMCCNADIAVGMALELGWSISEKT